MRAYHIFHSVFFIIVILISITITGSPVLSQTVSTDSFEKEITGKTIDGLMNVSSSIVKDSFVPVTHWQENDFLITFVPAYFQINRAYDDPEVKGRDLKGWATSLGSGYAYNKRLLFYGILAAQKIKGNLYGKMYKDPLPTVEADMNYRLFFFSPGTGFEILPGKWLSIPVYIGPFIQQYKLEVNLPREADSTGNSIEVNATGSGILYGLSGGFAISAKILDKVKITPYYLYIRSFNKPEADAEIIFTSSLPFPPSETQTESLNTENLNASMLGLSATLLSTSNISFSVSIGGYITSETGWYNEKFLNGLQMKSIVLAVTYTNSQPETE
jgi:hypothetical protein